MWPIFLFFSFSVSLGLFFTIKRVKETKGLTPIEIEDIYGVIGTVSIFK